MIQLLLHLATGPATKGEAMTRTISVNPMDKSGLEQKRNLSRSHSSSSGNPTKYKQTLPIPPNMPVARGVTVYVYVLQLSPPLSATVVYRTVGQRRCFSPRVDGGGLL